MYTVYVNFTYLCCKRSAVMCQTLSLSDDVIISTLFLIIASSQVAIGDCCLGWRLPWQHCYHHYWEYWWLSSQRCHFLWGGGVCSQCREGGGEVWFTSHEMTACWELQKIYKNLSQFWITTAHYVCYVYTMCTLKVAKKAKLWVFWSVKVTILVQKIQKSTCGCCVRMKVSKVFQELRFSSKRDTMGMVAQQKSSTEVVFWG